MTRQQLRHHYNREADVRHFSFDHPRQAKAIELERDFLLRLDPATEEVVGMTVMSFSRHCSFLRGRAPDAGEIKTREVTKALSAA